MLKTTIAKECRVECAFVDDWSQIESPPNVFLIDCEHRSYTQLRKMVFGFDSEFGDVPTALLNAQYSSQHESLLEWPCMGGIFYIDTKHDQLIKGLECLLNDDLWLPRKVLHNLLSKTRRAPHIITIKDAKVTKREKQILRQIKVGATNAAIAKELELSENTIKSHLYNVYKKIGVNNRLEAGTWLQKLSDDELL